MSFHYLFGRLLDLVLLPACLQLGLVAACHLPIHTVNIRLVRDLLPGHRLICFHFVWDLSAYLIHPFVMELTWCHPLSSLSVVVVS